MELDARARVELARALASAKRTRLRTRCAKCKYTVYTKRRAYCVNCRYTADSKRATLAVFALAARVQYDMI
eukprot:2429996-Lingulodinium_polyedra.AAC.1